MGIKGYIGIMENEMETTIYGHQPHSRTWTSQISKLALGFTAYVGCKPQIRGTQDQCNFGIVSIPNVRPFGYYSPCKPPFRVRSVRLL